MQSQETTLRFQRLQDDAVVPSRAHPTDAGLDLSAVESVVIEPGCRALVGTGLAVEIPVGWAGLVCPRSGLAVHHGISIVNGPGVIDAGYRGEIRVILHNTDLNRPFEVEPGMRIAQLVLTPVLLGDVEVADQLSSAARNIAGFGSTGTR